MKMIRRTLVCACLLLTAVFFVLTAQAAVARGDVDMNGELGVDDARYALRAAVGLEVYPEGANEFIAADVDGTGEIEVSDARGILRAAVGLDLLSYNDNFRMPLTIKETDDFAVVLVNVFADDMLQGFDFDVTNKTPSHSVEILVEDPAVNNYMPDGSAFDVTLDAGETRTCSMIFDRDLFDARSFIEGWVRDIKFRINAYDLSADTGNGIPRQLFEGIVVACPNCNGKAMTEDLKFPYDRDRVFLSRPGFEVAYQGNSFQEDETGMDPGLVNSVSLGFVANNYSGHTLYFYFDNAEMYGEALDADAGKTLFPGANGRTNLYVDVRPLHIYVSDLEVITLSLHVWDVDVGEEIYTDRYNISFGAG